jgi:hypothetical protein
VKYLLTSLVALSLLAIEGCNSSLSGIEGSELRKRAYRCLIETDLTAAEIQVCKNIQRECKRRQSEGQFDC